MQSFSRTVLRSAVTLSSRHVAASSSSSLASSSAVFARSFATGSKKVEAKATPSAAKPAAAAPKAAAAAPVGAKAPPAADEYFQTPLEEAREKYENRDKPAAKRFDVPTDGRPPLTLMGEEAKYAKALFSAVMKSSNSNRAVVDQAVLQLSHVAAQLKSNKELAADYSDRRKSQDERSTLLEAHLAKDAAYKKFDSKIVPRLMRYLVDMGAEEQFGEVVDNFKLYVAYYFRIIECSVTSAEPLSKKYEEAAVGKIKKMLDAKDEMKMEFKVDPTIMGGLKFQVGDMAADVTVASRLSRMRDNFRKAQ